MDLFGAVAGEEPEDEDESAEGGEGHRVAGHVDRLPFLVEPGADGERGSHGKKRSG